MTGGERSTEESAAGPDGAAGPDRPTVATASAEIPQAVSAQPTVATASTEVPQTTSARPAAVPQPASERMQSGWCYVVFGVFSTEENAARCREQLLREAPSLAVGVYPFGAKYMVSPFAAQDRGVCERFAREHRSAWPDLWIYAKK